MIKHSPNWPLIPGRPSRRTPRFPVKINLPERKRRTRSKPRKSSDTLCDTTETLRDFQPGSWYFLILASGDVVQLVRTLPCHGRGRGFESRRPRHSFQALALVLTKPSRAQKGTFSCPFLCPFSPVPVSPRPFPYPATSPDDDCDVPFASCENTKDKTAA